LWCPTSTVEEGRGREESREREEGSKKEGKREVGTNWGSEEEKGNEAPH